LPKYLFLYFSYYHLSEESDGLGFQNEFHELKYYYIKGISEFRFWKGISHFLVCVYSNSSSQNDNFQVWNFTFKQNWLYILIENSRKLQFSTHVSVVTLWLLLLCANFSNHYAVLLPNKNVSPVSFYSFHFVHWSLSMLLFLRSKCLCNISFPLL
jgi:hypothetical protein